jgi:hypothetical protein
MNETERVQMFCGNDWAEVAAQPANQTAAPFSANLLTVLRCAQADIEGLIELSGADPHDEADMMAANYAAQWQTLQELTAVIHHLQTPAPDTKTITVTNLAHWRNQAQRLAEIAAETETDLPLWQERDLDEERQRIEEEMAAYLAELLNEGEPNEHA